MPMPGVFEALFVFMVLAAGVLIPIILIVMLIIWLNNKKRRDNIVIERLVGIKQTLEDIREEIDRMSGQR